MSARDELPHRGWRAPAGLRVQLVAGVAIVSMAATLALAAIARFTAADLVEAAQVERARALGRALAALLPAQLNAPVALARRIEELQAAAGCALIDVYDARQRPIAGSGQPEGNLNGMRQALRDREQVVVPLGPLLEVSTPLLLDDRVVGAVRLQAPLGHVRWPAAFWWLVAAHGLGLLLFVTLVLGRYLARPLEGLQRGAARMAAGDLDTPLPVSGPYEVASLAESLNQMAAAIRAQLQEVERQRQSLIQSEKLASVGRLAAGVAHEIGNPMQSIVGFTDILASKLRRKEAIDGAAQLDMLGRIEAEANRIHGTIRELLEFARPARETVERVDLAAVVEQALALLRPQKRFREVEVAQRGLSGLPPVAAHGQRLVQVLVNLLLNAADAMEGAGSVEIAAQRVERTVELRIANAGPRIADEHRAQIFDPFFTTKDPGQGAGLGLAVARSIVEALGGTLELAEPATPTAFLLRLPLWVEGGRVSTAGA